MIGGLGFFFSGPLLLSRAESAKLLAGAHKVLGWVPVLGGLLGKAEQSQKRQGPQGV